MQNALADIGHLWGSDARLSLSGDFARSTNSQRSQERVLRRLMTNPGDSIFHPTYGAGLPARVGSILNIAEVRGLITTQMRLEESVSQTDPIKVDVQTIQNGVSVDITYTPLGDKQPVALSFDMNV